MQDNSSRKEDTTQNRYALVRLIASQEYRDAITKESQVAIA